jgi:segregation and condensation protein B
MTEQTETGQARTTEAVPTRLGVGLGAGLNAALEAILLTSEKPVSPARVAEALSTVGISARAEDISAAAEGLNAAYEQTGRSFRIELVAGGLRMMAGAELAPVLAAFHGARASTRLSRAALETLSIIAYRQPVTRAEIEAIRGVAAGDVVRSLLERRLITIAGRAEELGRPILYGTTPEFLRQFGLAKLDDLPKAEGQPRQRPAPQGLDSLPTEDPATHQEPA